ncbi:hypothetical protein [Tenacibaculum aiptasiae]|uniref:hypothetical protein n=1 Tax=Tenacibaculum aiptasiae TaxID=426481 RepID=UPI00158800F7|nr:hypothetical protein [Tenacibaculum aiptasiae]
MNFKNLKKYQLKKDELKNIEGGNNNPSNELQKFDYCPSGYVEVWINYRFTGCFLRPL